MNRAPTSSLKNKQGVLYYFSSAKQARRYGDT